MMGRQTMNDARSDCFPPWVRAFVAVVVLAPFAVAACGSGGSGTGVGYSQLPEGARSEALDHEQCSESGHRVEVLDTNGDGKPDIRRVFDKGSGKEVCRIADLNHDGKADLYEYFDSSGTIRRREFCYDDSGVVNAIEYYTGGKLVRREYDTSGHHRIDTWDSFDPNAPLDPKTGRPAHPTHRERDTTADGRIDQWWTWDGDKVSITVDRTGDGKPDPDTTIVLGGGEDAGGAPPAASVGGGAGAAAPDSGVASATSAPPNRSSADGGKP
jgi:hypothetical protein